jgi:hypothetical protein
MILFRGCIQKNRQPVTVSPTDENGFEMKMTGLHFIIFFHSDDDADARAVLAILEHEDTTLSKDYLGIVPSGIPVYLATTQGEYSRISEYPGDLQSITPDAVSVNKG